MNAPTNKLDHQTPRARSPAALRKTEPVLLSPEGTKTGPRKAAESADPTPVIACVVDAANSVHGRHFEVGADGGLLPPHRKFVTSSQSPICPHFKMAPGTVCRVVDTIEIKEK